MYTGITQGLFSVVYVDKQPGLTTYRVQLSQALSQNLNAGASIAIDGVCQTVVDCVDGLVTLNAMQETLVKTTLGDLYVGRKVSVERAARIGDENGGHELAGHVFEAGTIVDKRSAENNLCLIIKCSTQCIQYIFPKGFVGIDGSSLTVGEVYKHQGTFAIHLIPETLRLTNFGHKEIGQKVNIEVDAKAVILSEALNAQLAQIQHALENLDHRLSRLEIAQPLKASSKLDSAR
jgi:riboflavin synthase